MSGKYYTLPISHGRQSVCRASDEVHLGIVWGSTSGFVAVPLRNNDDSKDHIGTFDEAVDYLDEYNKQKAKKKEAT